MASWPASLPPKVQLEGFQGTVPDTLLETEMETGMPKTRRRYSAAPEPFQVSWVMTYDQLFTFREWFRWELADGALPFDWTHPLWDNACQARFVKSGLPSYTPHGSQYKVSATVWILP